MENPHAQSLSASLDFARIPIKVYDDDLVEVIGKKIFTGFEVNQWCVVTGYEMNEIWRRLETRGELVIDVLRKLDRLENFNKQGGRRRKIVPNSVGGAIAQKVFTWKISETHIYTIWRIQ